MPSSSTSPEARPTSKNTAEGTELMTLGLPTNTPKTALTPANRAPAVVPPSQHPVLSEASLSSVSATPTAPALPPLTIEDVRKLCNLQVSKKWLGRQVTFTIPAGRKGREVLEAIQDANPRANGRGIISIGCCLLTDDALNTPVKEATSITFVICRRAYGMERHRQEDYLARHGLQPVPLWIAAVGAALYRDRHGFPAYDDQIGTPQDRGDLFKSKWVRTESEAIQGWAAGLIDGSIPDAMATKHIIIAGIPMEEPPASPVRGFLGRLLMRFRWILEEI